MRDGWVLPLGHPDATNPSIAGAKAANLAVAAAAGLPTVPGFVITTTAVGRGLDAGEAGAAVRSAWQRLTNGRDDVSLVVRSSSTVEDAAASSLAGRFTSVLDVCGWPAFIDAVDTVIASAGAVPDDAGSARPMAVLVQPQIEARFGGVLFGVDPVTGERDRVVVEVVGARPDALVGGTVNADHYVLTRRGRVVERRTGAGAPPLPRAARHRLAALSVRSDEVFGTVQDLEWAVDASGRLWLLQSRPVTAIAATRLRAGHRRGAVVLGPGPVAETFPNPLRRLEAELWLEPLRDGIERALRATGAVGDDAIDRSPIVTAVGGWAAVDLGLIGVTSGRATLRQRASPIAIGRHLRTAWRVGRLRVALPRLAADIVATVDRDLSAIGRLDAADDDALAELLDRTRRELATVHTFEVLAGMLLHDGRAASNPRPPAGDALPTPIVALHALRLGREAGLTDADIVAHDPVVLALVPPTLTSDGDPCLPPDGPRPPGPIDDRPLTVDDLDLRDALRLRARWLQELTVRIVRTVAERLAGAERVATPELARELSVAELVGMLRSGAPAPADLAQRGLRQAGPPLPTAFELDVTGGVHTLRRGRGAAASGLPASAGRVAGVVRHRVIAGVAQPDTILVTRHLEPQLAPLLPSLAGLVAETGSALSHLAILAREAHVPAVVGVDDALRRFPPGTRLVIDGATGAIDVLDGPATDTDAMAVAVAS